MAENTPNVPNVHDATAGLIDTQDSDAEGMTRAGTFEDHVDSDDDDVLALGRQLQQTELGTTSTAVATPRMELVATAQNAAEATRSNSQTATSIATPTAECCACMDRFPTDDTIRAPCDDTFCRTCVVTMFTRSLDDESLFPPRCHGQPIPAEEHRDFIGAELVQRFLAKQMEHDNPNYCHDPQCAAFIPPNHVRNDVGSCERCDKKTCTICNKVAHEGECPEDPAMQELMSLAKDKKWQQCPSCHRLIELESGCYHIVCHCTAQFCFLCSAPWKTCACDQWDPEQLRQAEQELGLVAAAGPPIVAAGPPIVVAGQGAVLWGAPAEWQRTVRIAERINGQLAAFGRPPGFDVFVAAGHLFAHDPEFQRGVDFLVQVVPTPDRPRLIEVRRLLQRWLGPQGWAPPQHGPDLQFMGPPAPVPAPLRAPRARVQAPDQVAAQRQQRLRRIDTCAHRQYRRVRGPEDCDLCRERMPTYLRECIQCGVRVCQFCVMVLRNRRDL